jgi:hypothetical protein
VNSTTIFCQGCGAKWTFNEGFDAEMFYFASSTGELAKPTSPAHIAAADLTLVACPKDPMPQDESMGAPGEDGLQPGRSPDSGERSPGPGDSDALHGEA